MSCWFSAAFIVSEQELELLDIGASLVNVLKKLLEVFVKEMNDAFAFKMHFLTHVVQQASRHTDDSTKWVK